MDALTQGGEEGRSTLRKFVGRCEQSLIRKYPNGRTCHFNDIAIDKFLIVKLTRGTETSKYPEERTSNETPLVVVSESGPGQ